MKKKVLLGIFVVTMCFILLIPNQSLGYTVQGYNIIINVNENNTFDVTETIKLEYSLQEEEISIKIPVKDEHTRSDGSRARKTAKISNIKVSEKCKILHNSSDYKEIKIKRNNKNQKESKTYTIGYTYDIGKDSLKNGDEFYFILISRLGNSDISNAYFTINMPKPFNVASLEISDDNYNTINGPSVAYSVNGNTISGKLINTLDWGRALTVRLTLPEGYFTGTNLEANIYSSIVIAICLIFVLIAYRLWAKYGKDDVVTETVEFNPPEGSDSAETGFLYKDLVNSKSSTSLLELLANKGYIKVEQIKKGLFKPNRKFKITKIKEYDGNNKYEKMFFNGLFVKPEELAQSKLKEKIMQDAENKGKKITWIEAVELSKLMPNNVSERVVTETYLDINLEETLKMIETRLELAGDKSKIYDSSVKKTAKWLALMAIAIFALIIIKPELDYRAVPMTIIVFAFLLVPISIYGVIIFLIDNKSDGAGLCLLIIIFALIVAPVVAHNTMYIIMYIIGMLSIAIIIFFAGIMPKKTPYANKSLGQLKGLKRFIETTKTHNI